MIRFRDLFLHFFGHGFYKKPVAFFFFLFSFIASLPGQEYVVIDRLEIVGNDWTRDYIISKELDFEQGDTIPLPELMKRLDENRDRLLNTGLFNQVKINLKNWDLEKKLATIRIDLVENWFWYPIPIIELADRSFNEWLYQHDASLKRLNLGIRFMHINLSGNHDKLKFTFNTGFTQKYEVDYTFPYLNRKKTLGAYLNILYVTHKEIAFETRNNQLNFFRDPDAPLLKRFRTSLGLKYRKDKALHMAAFLEYHNKSIADTISAYLNPNYFQMGQSDIEHISFDYRMLYTKVDKKIYPTRGYRMSFNFRKDGFGIFPDLNHMHLAAAWEKHFRVTDYFSSGFKIKARKGFGFQGDVPYHYQGGLGYYDDVLSGYQLYVIDGIDFAYLRSIQKIRLADVEFNLKQYMPLKAFKVMPLKIYLGVHGDIGYAPGNQFRHINEFNKRMLLGGALSLDLVLYENYFLSCEFTINHLGEPGIFFQGTNTFE